MKPLFLLKRLAVGVTALAALLALIAVAGVTQPAQAIGKTELRRALLATVRVAAPVEKQKDMYSTGSGSILTADGFILTTFHVMGDVKTGKLYNKQGLAFIAVNPQDLKGLPTWTYQAVMVKGDPKLDLAVLKISAPFKGGGSLPENLGLVTISLADSDTVEVGDEVSVVGYPGIGGDSVTYTKGAIAGFLDEDEDGVNDWFKTDAEVNKGNSGGMAVNTDGEMIGIPTAGMTDVESAGKISLIRPVNLALPLLKAAKVRAASEDGKTTDGQARITSLIFTDQLDSRNRPGKAATTFPAGTQTVYAVFEYEGFTDGLIFEYAWTRDGEPDVSNSLEWESGESGSFWVSITNKRGIIEGAYELTLSLDGEVLRKGRMTVGQAKPVSTKPTFTTPIFAEDVTSDDKPVNPHREGEPFEEGTKEIYAFFDYAGMEDGLAWSYIWYIDDEEILRREESWEAGESGNLWINIYHKVRLPNGHYKLELYIEDELAAEAETDVGKGGGPIIEDEGVQVIGTIVDADTRRPIKGAVFIVLKPGVDARSFLQDPDEADIFGIGEADSKGQFTLNTLLQRGETYSLVAGAKGYQPAYQDDYTVAEDAESPLEFNVKLQKR